MKKNKKQLLLIFLFLLIGSLGIVKGSLAGSWSALSSGVNNSTALAVYNNELYVGGSFSTAGGITANNIAKWNGTSWSAVGSGVNQGVNTLAVYNNELYAGGYFTTAGGSAASHVAKWNGTSWSALSSGINSQAYAMAVYNNELYVGGNFTTAGGNVASYIAKWNGDSWSALGTGMNAEVDSFTVYNNQLFVGGLFSTANGVSANRIAQFDGTSSWSAVGSGMGSGYYYVYDLTVYNNELYAAGNFTTSSGAPYNYLAKWNGSSWSSVGSEMNQSINDLAVYNGELYAAGDFTAVGGVSTGRIARWNGASWNTIDPGTNSTINSLATFGDGLYVGGNFSTAGGNTANGIAKWLDDIVSPVTTASPAGGTYTENQSVTLTAVDVSSSISATYYTTDGSTPTTSSLVYSSPISITEDTTLKFFSVDSVGNTEEVKTETYIINKDDTAEKVAEAERKLKKGKKIYLVSELNGQSISGQSLKITFTNLPYKLTKNSNYWIQLVKHKAYPGSLELGSHLSLKKYWLFKTNINKYKVNNSTQKFKIKIVYKYTAKELKVLKNIEPSLPTKDLKLKYRVKAGLNWYQLNNQWKNAKVKHNLSKKKFTVKYFKKFLKSTYYFAIIKK